MFLHTCSADSNPSLGDPTTGDYITGAYNSGTGNRFAGLAASGLSMFNKIEDSFNGWCGGHWFEHDGPNQYPG
jgi:hypothetical protein